MPAKARSGPPIVPLAPPIVPLLLSVPNDPDAPTAFVLPAAEMEPVLVIVRSPLLHAYVLVWELLESIVAATAGRAAIAASADAKARFSRDSFVSATCNGTLSLRDN